MINSGINIQDVVSCKYFGFYGRRHLDVSLIQLVVAGASVRDAHTFNTKGGQYGTL